MTISHATNFKILKNFRKDITFNIIARTDFRLPEKSGDDPDFSGNRKSVFK